MKRVCLDLCAGLGGLSEAFVRSPNWEVIRIDNNELLSDVPHMRIADITQLDPRAFSDADVILAGPTCTDFSMAYSAPRSVAWREGIRGSDYKPDMTLVRTVQNWISIIKPDHWLIENVNGSQEFFRKVRLYPSMKHGPFVLYGTWPRFSMPREWRHSKFDGDTWSSDPLRANRRGKIPLELSRAILESLEGCVTLERWTS